MIQSHKIFNDKKKLKTINKNFIYDNFKITSRNVSYHVPISFQLNRQLRLATVSLILLITVIYDS